jgi:hypothetical protein
MDAQIGTLALQHKATLEAREDAIRAARSESRSKLVQDLSPVEKRVLAKALPTGPMDRFLKALTHEEHFDTLNTRLDLLPSVRQAAPQQHRGPMDKFTVTTPRIVTAGLGPLRKSHHLHSRCRRRRRATPVRPTPLEQRPRA